LLKSRILQDVVIVMAAYCDIGFEVNVVRLRMFETANFVEP